MNEDKQLKDSISNVKESKSLKVAIDQAELDKLKDELAELKKFKEDAVKSQHYTEICTECQLPKSRACGCRAPYAWGFI